MQPTPLNSFRLVGRGLAALVVLVVVTLGGFLAAAYLRERDVAAAIAPLAGRFLETGDGQIFLQDEGPRAGRPIVLVHGTAAWSEFWRGTIDHLKRAGYRVIALDLPPFGFSDRQPTHSYRRADQARRIASVLDQLELENAVMVGHSFGAGATVETVMRHGRRIGGLVLVAPALSLPENGAVAASSGSPAQAFLGLPVIPEALLATTATNPTLTRWLLSTMLARKEAATEELAAVLRRPMSRRETTRAFVQWARYFVGPDRTALSLDPIRYGSLEVPASLIWGTEDTVTPLAQGRRLQSLMPGTDLKLIEGAGHIPQIEAPARFRFVLVEMIAGLEQIQTAKNTVPAPAH